MHFCVKFNISRPFRIQFARGSRVGQRLSRVIWFHFLFFISMKCIYLLLAVSVLYFDTKDKLILLFTSKGHRKASFLMLQYRYYFISLKT